MSEYNFQPGMKVVVDTRHDKSIKTIKRVTPKGTTIIEYENASGQPYEVKFTPYGVQIGGDKWWPTQITPATPEMETAIVLENRRKWLATYFGHSVDWSRFAIDKLEAVYKLILAS
jgi:hypothetical protein